MNAVTDVVKSIKQPYGGYLPISKFEEIELGGEVLSCNIQPIIIGKTLDSILRLIVGTDKYSVFNNSITGYENRLLYFSNQFSIAGNKQQVYEQIKQEDNKFDIYRLIDRVDSLIQSYDIYNLCIVVSLIHQYDIWQYDFGYISGRSSISSSRPKYYKKKDICVLMDLYKRLVSWLCTMLSKGIVFDYRFYPNGYTDKIKYGVGDFVCENTLFDLKCIKSKPSSYHTLQLLIYYVMGIHSNNKLYRNVKNIGIYSPIQNKVWIMPVKNIPKELVHKISSEVIGYNELYK